MRKEPFAVGDYVHILKRGAKKLPIIKDTNDRWRFLKILRHLNDEFISEYWEEDVETNKSNAGSIFDRPDFWPKEKPLIMILAYTLMPNHFHILAKEIIEGGIARFMQKLGNSMTGHFNLKYKESGTIFQGSYKARRVTSDEYLRYLAVYIMVKNVFELHPNGMSYAIKNFEKAFDWAVEYQFSSLADYHPSQVRPAGKIIQKEILGQIFSSPRDFKNFARDCILGKVFSEDEEAANLAMAIDK